MVKQRFALLWGGGAYGVYNFKNSKMQIRDEACSTIMTANNPHEPELHALMGKGTRNVKRIGAMTFGPEVF